MEEQRPTKVSGKDEIGTIGTIISIISVILNISSVWVLQGGKWLSCNIFDSKDVAIASIANGAADVECENESVCGHVFYHWCRGEDDAAYYTAEDEFAKNHPHNRRSSTEKSADGYGNYNSFTCFYKAEQEIPYPLFSVEGSTSVWMPNYNACWDSYWYWMAEVRECNVRISVSVQNFSISIT